MTDINTKEIIKKVEWKYNEKFYSLLAFVFMGIIFSYVIILLSAFVPIDSEDLIKIKITGQMVAILSSVSLLSLFGWKREVRYYLKGKVRK
jgi:O-antigen ligase